MVEPLVGRGRRRVHVGRGRRDEDVGTAELEVDTRLALLRGAQDLGAEHALVPLRRLLRIGAAQMDVVIGERRHVVSSRAFAVGLMKIGQAYGARARWQAPEALPL